jgi:TPR repeat protein
MLFDQPEQRHTTREVLKTMRLVPFERHRTAIRWQFARGVLIGILASAAVVIPALKYSQVRRNKAALPKTSGQTASGNSDAQAASGAPIETVAGTSPAAIQPKPQASKPANHFADNRVQPAVAGDRVNQAPLSVSQPAPLTDASLTKREPTKRTLATLAQLWASVEAGDSKAAVALADVYLRGEGVPVNCEQARVLLVVASNENNAEATKKLQDLDATGCTDHKGP